MTLPQLLVTVRVTVFEEHLLQTAGHDLAKAQLSDASVLCSVTIGIQRETVLPHTRCPVRNGHMSNTLSGMVKKPTTKVLSPKKSPRDFSGFTVWLFNVTVQDSKRPKQKSLPPFKWSNSKPVYYFF